MLQQLTSEPKFGDTRIKEETFGDGRKQYTPEKYEMSQYNHRFGAWYPLEIPGSGKYTGTQYQCQRYAPTTLEEAQDILRAHWNKRVVKTEYIKYP